MIEPTSHEINIALLTLGGLILGLGLFSGLLKERLWLSDPLLALLVGVLLGPAVLGWLDLQHWGNPEGILEQGARLAIAIQVMGVALRLPKAYPFKHWRVLGTLLGLAMPLMWLVSSLLIYWILGFSIWVSLLIGAIITPTDPVIATSVVTGKVAECNLPQRLRDVLSAESAANDGLGYLFVLLPILMLTRPSGEAVVHWLSKTLLWEVGAAIIVGALMGYAAGKLLVWAERKQTMNKPSFLAYTVALSLFVLSVVKLLGSDGILAVFIAGIAFDIVVGGKERSEEEGVQEAVDRFFTLYIFVLLGLYLPWQDWFALGWQGLGLAIAILLLRRVPALLLLRPLLGKVKALPDALFMGWFGPIGVAAILYALLAVHKAGVSEAWSVGSLVICTSILVHGMTAVPFAKRYAQITGFQGERR